MGGKFSQVHYRERDTAVLRDFEILTKAWGRSEIEALSLQLRRISFNFCLTPSHFQELLQLQHNDLFAPLVARWFDGLKNTPQSTVVNGLEFLAALAITGAFGKLLEKAGFVFDLFDFNQSGAVTRDELLILLKSSVRGLTKITRGLGPQLVRLCPMPQIEDLASLCFQDCGLDPTDDLRKELFLQWVRRTPKITNLLRCYVPKDRSNPDDAAGVIQRVVRGMLGRTRALDLKLQKRLQLDAELDVAAQKIQDALLHRKRRQEGLRRSKVERNASSGAIYSFGANAHGLLGHQHLEPTAQLKQPRLVLYFKHNDQRVVGIATSRVHACAVTSGGAAYTWGACPPGAFGSLDKPAGTWPRRVDDLTDVAVRCMALGARHSMALSDDGVVYTWGAGEFGQLGHGDPHDADNELFQREFDPHTSRHYPVIDLPLKLDKSLFDDVQIVAIACGYYFCVALAADGCVYTWGEGSDGQLGLGYADAFCVGFLDDYIANTNYTYMHSPQYVNLDEPIGAIGVGGNRAYAVGRSHRNVYEWGAGFRRASESVFSPQLSPVLSTLYVESIRVGGEFAMAITGSAYIKLPDAEAMYAIAAAFGASPVEICTGLSAPLIAPGVIKAATSYIHKEDYAKKMVYVDRGKPTGIWLTIDGDDALTLLAVPSTFGPEIDAKGTRLSIFFTPEKLASLQHYVRPDEIQGKLVVLHFEEADLPMEGADDDVATVIERLMQTLVAKVKDAQEAGAAAVAIVFTFMAEAFPLATTEDDAFPFRIPSVMLNATAGQRLLDRLASSKRADVQLYRHEDKLWEQVGDGLSRALLEPSQIVQIQSLGALAVIVGQNAIDLTHHIFDAGYGDPLLQAKKLTIPVLMVSHEASVRIKETYRLRLQDTFAEIGIGSFGDVYAWGAGDHGVLGLGDVDNETIFRSNYDPATNSTYPCVDTPEWVEALVDTKIVALSCGATHAAAVSGSFTARPQELMPPPDTGDLYTWGSGASGKLGHGSDNDEASPRLVDALHSVKVAAVACGRHHTLVVTAISETKPIEPTTRACPPPMDAAVDYDEDV
ncbi:regulator of chromosome condensation (RCC1) [Achlya hypogyna]|uniref:Regulator of chromosome condensation (RCC1) n=1 Tax=Achlya hypogyna TaxID=1202772 RepID=A0A1V9ZDB2_ACHHY|nr:regulator of chromosome condensation (RCC1) [Achlya hypogyna]